VAGGRKFPKQNHTDQPPKRKNNAQKDDGEYPPTLEDWRRMTRHAARNLTDDPIGAHMRRRTVSDAIAEEPWRLRHTPVDGERTVE
jgi:hypothetical protein